MNATAKNALPRDFWQHSRTILLAIGNSGREDDGLGWAFADWLEATGRFAGDIERRYQLQVEDADLISRYERVIFVDASREGPAQGFAWRRTRSAAQFAFSTHALAPGTVLKLAADLYGACPEAWTLAIAGERWELGEGLSEGAEENLMKLKLELGAE